MANNGVATRYQNALTYAPGRSVGFYPDAGWQGSGGSAQTQMFQPATFAPFNALATQPTTTQQQAPGYGVDRLGSMAATMGLDRLGNYIVGQINAPNLTPSDPYTGPSSATMDPYAGAGEGVDAAIGAAQMPPSGGWGEGSSTLSQIGDGISDLGDAAFSSVSNINPLSMGAGMVGSWAGGTLAANLVRGDAEQQPLASSIGGTLGGIGGGLAAGAATGAAAGSIVPGIGTLIGAFVGALAGGALGGGSPDIPYSWSSLGLDPATQGLSVSPGDALNHGNAGYASALGNNIAGYIGGRAAQDGYQLDPTYLGTGFDVGTYDGNLTYQFNVPGFDAHSQGEHQYQWQGQSPQELGAFAYDDLVRRGILTASPGMDWASANADLTTVYQQHQDALRAQQAANPGDEFSVPDALYTSVYQQQLAGQYPDQYGGYNSVSYLPRSNLDGGDGSAGPGGTGGPGSPGDPGNPGSDPGPPGTAASSAGVPGDAAAGVDAATSGNPGEAPGTPGEAPGEGAPGEAGPGDYRVGGLIQPAGGKPKKVKVNAHTGEFVIRPEAVKRYGVNLLSAINNGTYGGRG